MNVVHVFFLKILGIQLCGPEQGVGMGCLQFGPMGHGIPHPVPYPRTRVQGPQRPPPLDSGVSAPLPQRPSRPCPSTRSRGRFKPLLRLPPESGPPAPSSLRTRRPSAQLPVPSDPRVRPLYLFLRAHHAATAAATYPAPHIPSTSPDFRSALNKPDLPLPIPSRGGPRSGRRGGSETRRARGGAKGGPGLRVRDAGSGTATQRPAEREKETQRGRRPGESGKETQREGQKLRDPQRGDRDSEMGDRGPERKCQRQGRGVWTQRGRQRLGREADTQSERERQAKE